MYNLIKSDIGAHSTRVCNTDDGACVYMQHTLPSYDFEYDGIPLVVARPFHNKKFIASSGWVILEPKTGLLLTDRNFGTIEKTISHMKRTYPSPTKLRKLIQTAKRDLNLEV